MDIAELGTGKLVIVDIDKLLIGIKNISEESVEKAINKAIKATEKEETLKGIEGIMEIFDCGKNKAQDIKNSGAIDEAIIPLGERSFLVKKNKALELWAEGGKQALRKRRRKR